MDGRPGRLIERREGADGERVGPRAGAAGRPTARATRDRRRRPRLRAGARDRVAARRGLGSQHGRRVSRRAGGPAPPAPCREVGAGHRALAEAIGERVEGGVQTAPAVLLGRPRHDARREEPELLLLLGAGEAGDRDAGEPDRPGEVHALELGPRRLVDGAVVVGRVRERRPGA